MSKEQYEKLLITLSEAAEEIEAIPGSTANGLLLDAARQVRSAGEHLKRYMQLSGAQK